MISQRKILVLLLTLCLLILCLSILPVHGETRLYENVLRLHVLANSDSEEDQALKLKVRDAVLAEAQPILSPCRSRDEAIEAVIAHTADLELAARKAVSDAGRNDSVRIELNEEVYPTKEYEAYCFPSGSYVSLRVILGDGEGQNWWCVLFPPLCLASATQKNEDACIAVGLTGDQYRIITETDSPTYSVRFRILEVFEEALRS